MYDYIYRIYDAIVQSTDSDLVLFFVILFASITPAYVLIFKDRKSSRQHDKDKQEIYVEREKEVVGVIKEMSDSNRGMAMEFSAVVAENTAVISSFKALLTDHGTESKHATSRIHERIDAVSKNTSATKVDTETIKADVAHIRGDVAIIKLALKINETKAVR